MNHSDHSWENCPDLNPASKSEATRWYPLLRRLHAAGWQHIVYGRFGVTQHVWRRNDRATNQQQITVDELLSIDIHGVTMSAAGLTPEQCHLVLSILGAFVPAPSRVDPPPTATALAAREALLIRAANDPTVDDDVFTILSRAIDRRPL